jgi:hypothetical protein
MSLEINLITNYSAGLMKKIITFSILLIISSNSFCQEPGTSDTLSKKNKVEENKHLNSIVQPDYRQQSKKEKTIAWIAAFAGAALITTSEIISKGDNKSNFFSDALKVAGITGAYISVRFFINASKHKKGKESNPYPLF